ncbi:MAG: SPOR domain-containing protein [Candidatus Muiribacteriota bacterium]
MSNFDWEQIEKDANRKKFMVSALILIIIAFSLFFYFKNDNTQKKETVVSGHMENGEEKETHSDEIEEVENDFTVEIGRFPDFDSARNFVLVNEISNFNIYRKDDGIYVNTGKLNNRRQAHNIADNFISEGFPASVSLLSEKKQYKKLDFEEEEKKIKKEEEEKENEEKEEKEENQQIDELDNEIVKPLDGIEDSWTIQIAAFEDLKDAAFMKNNLRFDGIESTIVKEKNFFKVWVGFYESKEEARDFSQKLDSEKISGVYIRRTK